MTEPPTKANVSVSDDTNIYLPTYIIIKKRELRRGVQWESFPCSSFTKYVMGDGDLKVVES